MMRVLSSSISVSLKNARLFDEIKKHNITLEEKVKERTSELENSNSELSEKNAKIDNLLLNILPSKVADDLQEHGYTVPEEFDNVTVMFSDIVNFTDISSNMQPADLINELNEMFTVFDEIMEKNGCERIKTIGDAYLAVCGMPESNIKHAENMVKSAKEIISYLESRNGSWKVRIGINTGKVVGGVVGTKKYIYDVFGDTINTASRMETTSEKMRINISQSTYDLVKNSYSCIGRGSFNVKGKGLTKMYYVE